MGKKKRKPKKAGKRAKATKAKTRKTRSPKPAVATVEINRAPVLTLWGAVGAERLGYDRDAALTLGKAVAG